MVELFCVTVFHHQDPVRVNHCGQSMCNYHHSAILELGPEDLLDLIVGLQIDIGSGLVEHKDFGLPKNGSSQAE